MAGSAPPPAGARQATGAITSAAKAKYDDEEWLAVAKPLNDELRERQKAALIAYVLSSGLATLGGIPVPQRSSKMAWRRMLRSTTAMRSSSQFSA